MAQESFSDEIASFEGLWEGGYYEGDPREPLSKSTYGSYGFMSVLHATYLRCIKPYVKEDTVALEIGPGRGAWTKTMLDAREIWALDALSAEHNRFFEYVGSQPHVRYLKVTDFECRDLPEDHFDYVFSFGCLCHVSFDGISAYARNLLPKLKSGANCFWMIGDKAKYERMIAAEEKNDIWLGLSPKRRLMPVRKLFEAISRATRPAFRKQDDFEQEQGRWHDAGESRTCKMLEGLGYKIVDSDVGTVLRDPVIHFMKP